MKTVLEMFQRQLSNVLKNLKGNKWIDDILMEKMERNMWRIYLSCMNIAEATIFNLIRKY